MTEDVDGVRKLFQDIVQDLVPIIGAHLDTIGSNPDEYVPGLTQRIGDVVGDGQLRVSARSGA